MYRAEDAMFLLRKRQWEKEDAEFAKEQERRKKEAHQRRIKKNRERRLRKEEDEREEVLKLIKPKTSINPGDKMLIKSLKSHFHCPICESVMSPPSTIYQCEDGHILCQDCKKNPDIKVIMQVLQNMKMAFQLSVLSCMTATCDR